MSVLDTVRRMTNLAGYDVTEEEAPRQPEDDDRSWGSPRVNVTVSRLHSLEPVVVFRREHMVIHFGRDIGDLVRQHMTTAEIDDLAMGLSRRVLRELHDSAMQLAQARRSYVDDRKRRLAGKS